MDAGVSVDGNRVRREVAVGLEEAASDHWNEFYRTNRDRFYKDRHWFTGEFGDHLAKRVFLEVGCGTGSTIYPLLDVTGPDSHVYACDFAPEAVELVRRHKGFSSGRVTVFTADITRADVFHGRVPASGVDVCMMVFVLSAISPLKMRWALENVRGVLVEGGVVCFRDYARGDLCEKRMAGGGRRRELSPSFYVRGDGTRCFYFTVKVIDGLFVQSGFEPVHGARIVVKEELNRKTGEGRIRRYVQGVYRKAARREGCEENVVDPFADDYVVDVIDSEGTEEAGELEKVEVGIGCLSALKIPPARHVDRLLALELCSWDIMGTPNTPWVTHSIEVVSESSSGLLSFACLQASGTRRHICCTSSPRAMARMKRVFTENSSRFLWERLRVGRPEDVEDAQRILLEWRPVGDGTEDLDMLRTAAGLAARTGALVVTACEQDDFAMLLERAGEYGLTLTSRRSLTARAEAQSLNQRSCVVAVLALVNKGQDFPGVSDSL